MQYHRLLMIDELIASSRYPSIKKLSTECECGPRQIHRDLADLRAYGDREPLYCQVRKGYYYPKPPIKPLATLFGLAPDLGNLQQFQKAIQDHKLVTLECQSTGKSMDVVPIAITAPADRTLVVSAEIPTVMLKYFPIDRVEIREVRPFTGTLPSNIHGRMLLEFARKMETGPWPLAFSA